MTVKVLSRAPRGAEEKGYYTINCYTRTHLDPPLDVGSNESYDSHQMFLQAAKDLAKLHDRFKHRGHGDLRISWHQFKSAEEIALENATALLQNRTAGDKFNDKSMTSGDDYEASEKPWL